MLWAGQRDPHWRLETLRVEPAGNRYLKPGPFRYSCQLTFDRDIINQNLQLSNNDRKVTNIQKAQSDTDDLDRRNIPQLLCGNGIKDCCYWEVEWRGKIEISVSYRGLRRRGLTNDSVSGKNEDSWCLSCSDDGYSAVHYKNRKLMSSTSFPTVSNRVAVYVDYTAGSLSFYKVSSDSLIHIHTFNTTFTDTLYPGFTVLPGSSVFLC
ncbi:stonustoxin subunit beta-like [Poeciliopsis prolifica]|uniref:stonustoxin subunit beta-like n=1 Tax=Poeciliopsis prolifica TaxID=188132 RepID=UPI002414358F|nr:stonustoxin subunit beta-like [Poeciliopsis prolifica]